MLRGSRSGTIPQICPPAHAVAKAELSERWRRGESLKAIGRAFDNPSRQCREYLARYNFSEMSRGSQNLRGERITPHMLPSWHSESTRLPA